MFASQVHTGANYWDKMDKTPCPLLGTPRPSCPMSFCLPSCPCHRPFLTQFIFYQSSLTHTLILLVQVRELRPAPDLRLRGYEGDPIPGVGAGVGAGLQGVHHHRGLDHPPPSPQRHHTQDQKIIRQIIRILTLTSLYPTPSPYSAPILFSMIPCTYPILYGTLDLSYSL